MPSHIKTVTLKDGTKRYKTQVQVPGPDGGLRYACETFDLLRDAKAHVAKILEARGQGQATVLSKELLSSHLAGWLTLIRSSVRENTFQSYEALVRNYIAPRLGGYQLRKLTPAVIQSKLYDAMQADGLGARTVRLTHSVLHNALDAAVGQRKLSRNPAKAGRHGVRLPKEDKADADIRPLDQGEARAFLEIIDGDRLRAFFHLSLSAGMRPSEIMGLQWSDLDLDAGRVAVRRVLVRVKSEWWLREPKTARGNRSIPLPPTTVEALRSHRRQWLELKLKLGSKWPGLDFVFVNDLGLPLERHNFVRRHFKPALTALGAKLYPAPDGQDVTPEIQAKRDQLYRTRLYDLRHTHATLLLLQNVNPKVVSERLGHSTIVITLDTYSHVLPSMQADATATVGSLLYG
jgi:integrase